MTDPNPARRRSKRGGRHRRAVPPRVSRAVSEEQARRNREQAFGTRQRTWVDARGAEEPRPTDSTTAAETSETVETPDAVAAASTDAQPAEDRTPESTEPAETGPSDDPDATAAMAPIEDDPDATAAMAPVEDDPDATAAMPPIEDETEDSPGERSEASDEQGPEPSEDAEADEPAQDSPADEEDGDGTSAAAASARSERSRRRADLLAERGRSRTPGGRPGSLPLVAAWTALTTVVPGAGLLTTPMRRLGWAMLAIMMTLTVIVLGVVLFTDPIRSGIMLATSRTVLVTLLAGAIVFGVVWCGQILLTGLAQSNRQRLVGGKRVAALLLALALTITVAIPFGRGVQSLWAAQGLLGSETVFSGLRGEGRTVEGRDPWKGVGRINIMMLGQDAGEDRSGTRPDTIMVASIDTETGRTALFSIPRNLEHVEFPEGTVAAERFPDGFRYFGPNQDLINAVWTWAEEEKDLFPDDVEDPGLTATQWAVEETLGLDIDYYAMVNLQGFEDLVDAIGGVEMNVERRIPIGGGINQATGGRYEITGYIEPGEQKLDGYQALWYARSREGSDDFNRMCRQQRIVRVVTEEANPQTLALSIPGLVSATERNIETSIPPSDIDAFVELALRIKDSGFTSYPITPEVTKPYDVDWDYLKKWVQASIDESMKQVGPTSVAGEKDTAATEESGSAKPSDGGSSTPEESSTASEEPTDEASEESTAPEEGSSSTSEKPKKPKVEKDPLRSCMPGYDEEEDQQGDG